MADEVPATDFSKPRRQWASHLRRCFFDSRYLLLAIAFLATSIPARLAQGDPPTIYLGPGAAWSITSDKPNSSRLIRELARQALLIAAREDFGLTTRDTWLGDEMPSSGDNAPFDLICSAGRPSLLEILRGFGPAQRSIWQKELSLSKNFNYSAYVEQMEAMSRGEFSQFLAQQGFKRLPTVAPNHDALSADLAKWLTELNYPSQFAALRKLHALRDEQRDNPIRLAALVRGYATLGMMSEYFWHPMHQVFKARALLYAERLTVVDHRSAWALAHRAFARSLVGLHAAALDDLAAVTADPKSHAADFPKWIGLLTAFCTFNADAIKAPGDPALRQLAAMLRLAMAEQSDVPMLIPRTAIAEAANAPECYRICDGYYHRKYFNHPDGQVEQPANGSDSMGRTLYDQLTSLPDLPAGVANIIAAPPPQELAERGAVMHELVVDKTSTKSVDEFTWPLLGRILQEVCFIQAWRELAPYDTSINLSGTNPSDENVTRLKPIYGEHRYAGYLQMSYSDSEARQKAYEQLLKNLDPESFEYHYWPLIDYLMGVSNGKLFDFDYFNSTLFARMDKTPFDLIRQLPFKGGENLKDAKELLAVSPYHPVARSMLLDLDWNDFQSDAAEWERTSQTQPRVLVALAKHVAEHDPAAAERLYRLIVDSSPTAENVAALARAYDGLGKRKEWLATVKRLATLPDVRDRGQVHADLLLYYINSGNLTNATAEAAEAADAKTPAGFLGAAGFYELQQNFEAAETCFREASEASASTMFDWYFFCRRTGEGDAKAALSLAEKSMAQREQTKFINTDDFYMLLAPAGAFCLLTDRPEKARRYFTQEFDRNGDPFCGLHAALISDQLKDANIRDRMLADIASRHARWEKIDPRRPHKEIVALAAMFAADLEKKGTADLDLDAITKLISRASEIERINCYYFVGRYLTLHGKPEKGAEMFLAAMPLLPMRAVNRTLAGQTLTDGGMPPALYQGEMKNRWGNRPVTTPKKSK